MTFYNQAATDLAAIRSWWRALPPSQQNSQATIDRLVERSERIIRAEHVGWVQEMQDAMTQFRLEESDDRQASRERREGDADEPQDLEFEANLAPGDGDESTALTEAPGSSAARTIAAMLKGRLIHLRPVRETDLDRLYEAHTDIRARGAYFPLGVRSEPAFRREFAENGFWQRTEGMLVIVTADGEIAGHIEFFRPVSYWDAFELSYQLYDDRHAGHGYVSEAVRLLVDYLFANKKEHRIHLAIVPENAASRRIAEKCGFTLEGTARGAFFNGGRNVDVLLYSLLRTDPRPWATGTAKDG